MYGHHFSQAGHQVTFLVKEKYKQAVEQKDTVLYYLNKDKSLKKPIIFSDYSVISSWDEANDFDLIALTISSNALRQLPLAIIKEKMAAKAQLLMLQPSDEDFNYLSSSIDRELILQGMITLISYPTAEVNHKVSPIGTAYYLPPLPMPLSVIPETAETTISAKQIKALTNVVKLFNGAQIKARKVDSALDESRILSAFTMTLLCVLEAANWEFERLNKSNELLQQLSEGQNALLSSKLSGGGISLKCKQLLLKALLRPWFYKSLIWLAPKVIPLPIEAYLKKHFLKVRPQTVMYMQDYYSQHPSNALENLILLLGEEAKHNKTEAIQGL